MAEVKKIIQKLEEKLLRLKKAVHEKNLSLLLQKAKEEGWGLFHYYSDYYGSHDEYEEGDEEDFLLFSPTIVNKIENFATAKFSHGHFSESDDHEMFNKLIFSLRNTWVKDNEINDDFNDVDVVKLKENEYDFLRKEGIRVIRE
ncbi:MAG: hypothetical protein ACP5OE_08800 [Thermodesulfobium sp.]